MYAINMISPSTQPSTDRRVRRSRQALRDALVALVLENGYDAVTVEAIIRRADVARATFYAHYSDKAELLAALVEDLATELTARLVPIAATGPVVRGQAVRELFRHADERRELYRVTLSGAAGGRARTAYERALTRGVQAVFTNATAAGNAVPRLPVEAAARAWTGSHLALLDWWLNEQPQLSADELTLIAMQLLVHGYAWANGLDSFTFDDADLRAPATR
jgi:AcrR family transcriptional regulator